MKKIKLSVALLLLAGIIIDGPGECACDPQLGADNAVIVWIR